MKSVSLVLRIVAIVGAIACVALWFQTKGIIKQATSDMKGVDGVTLLEKSAKVPAIIEERGKLGTELSASRTRVADLDNKGKELASTLESERARNVRTNQDLVKAQTELRQTKIKADDLEKDITKLKTTISALEREITTKTGQDESAAEIEKLKNQYNNLNSQYVAIQSQYAEAKKKADLLDIAVVIETKRIEGNQEITEKRFYPPYVAEGEIATVTIVEGRDDLIALNRGKNKGLGEKQLIDLKNKSNGDLIARVTVVEIGPDFAIASVNPHMGKPETLENGDMLELVPTVELKSIEESHAAEPAAGTPAVAAPVDGDLDAEAEADIEE